VLQAAFKVLCGACFFLGLFVILGTLTFWTTETLEIMSALTFGGIETSKYPLSIYRAWFRKFFTIGGADGQRNLFPCGYIGTNRSNGYFGQLPVVCPDIRSDLFYSNLTVMADRRPALSVDRKLR